MHHDKKQLLSAIIEATIEYLSHLEFPDDIKSRELDFLNQVSDKSKGFACIRFVATRLSGIALFYVKNKNKLILIAGRELGKSVDGWDFELKSKFGIDGFNFEIRVVENIETLILGLQDLCGSHIA